MKVSAIEKNLCDSNLKNINQEKGVDNKDIALEEFIVERLILIMEQRKLSRYRLGKLTNITQASLSSILSRKCAPSIYTIDRLCTGLNISVGDFLKKR